MPLLRITIDGQTRLLESFTQERAAFIADNIAKSWPRLAELGNIVMTSEEGNVTKLLKWEKKHDRRNAA